MQPEAWKERVCRLPKACRCSDVCWTGGDDDDLPEQTGGPRNWDYQYRWLRDAYFTLTAFNNLGQFEEGRLGI